MMSTQSVAMGWRSRGEGGEHSTKAIVHRKCLHKPATACTELNSLRPRLAANTAIYSSTLAVAGMQL